MRQWCWMHTRTQCWTLTWVHWTRAFSSRARARVLWSSGDSPTTVTRSHSTPSCPRRTRHQLPSPYFLLTLRSSKLLNTNGTSYRLLTLHMWNVKQRPALIQFHSIASNLLISTSFDLTAKLWDLETSKVVRSFQGFLFLPCQTNLTMTPHIWRCQQKTIVADSPVSSLAWSSDGKTFATATTKDKMLRLYDPRASTPLLKVSILTFFIPSLFFCWLQTHIR